MNFARRTECNKCGAPSSTGPVDNRGTDGGNYSRGSSGGGYGDGRGGTDNGGRGGNYGGGRGSNYDGGRGGGLYAGNQGRDASNYGQSPHENYPPPANSYGRNPGYGLDNAIPPPKGYTGGPTSYPPTYGAPTGYGGGAPSESRDGGRSGQPGSYSGGQQNTGGAHGGNPADTVKVKQCDSSCDDTCENSRIYVSNLPPDVTIDELRELFGNIGLVIYSTLLSMYLAESTVPCL